MNSITSEAHLRQRILKYSFKHRVAAPRHNDKAEGQYRTDEKRFYKKMEMYNLAEVRSQLTKYNKKSNNKPKVCLELKTPNEVLEKHLAVMCFSSFLPLIRRLRLLIKGKN